MRPKPPANIARTTLPQTGEGGPLLFMIVAGVFFFIAVFKFGVPVVLDSKVIPPEGLMDAIFSYTWQDKWGYLLMVPLFLTGFLAIRWKPLPKQGAFLLLLPLLWLIWEFIAATGTIEPSLSRVALAHFSGCVGLFYLGFFALRGTRNPWPVWAGLGLALCWVLHVAMTQHFGGLKATLEWTMKTQGSDLADPTQINNPEFIKRMNSLRVSGTLMYPNALAGAILLLLPITLVFLWRLSPKLRTSVRCLFVAIFGGCGMACLYWSGSKAALLIMMFLGVVLLLHLPMRMAWKATFVCAVLVIGLAGFAYKYAQSRAQGKTSMVARIGYWQAALQIVRRHPLFGTGPGTFGPSYEAIKSKDSEMARLAHNDFLEQASDSGILGFLTYFGFIAGSMIYLYRYIFIKNDPLFMVFFAVWLGLLGLFLHSCMEFHLYYPALAWPAFFLLGWLWGLGDPQPSSQK